jgi:molybdate transport system ATP-binding protein
MCYRHGARAPSEKSAKMSAPLPTSVRPSVHPLVSLEHVNVHLGTRHVLRDVSWQLAPGQHWAFTGRNGSGKSTLLRVICGEQWLDPDGGTRTYAFDGVVMPGVPSAKRRIGHVAPEQQEYYTRLELPIVGRNVIESGFDDSLYVHRPLEGSEREQVDALLDRLRLHDLARKRIHSLSFGQMRRLLIARAIVRRPALLVLDEFTNGLDREARRDVLTLLEELADEVQMIFASHRNEDFIPAVTHRAAVQAGQIVDPDVGRATNLAPNHGLLSQVAPHPNPSVDDTPLFEVARASVYRGRTLVLRDVTWSIRPGEHTAIVGANGAGKSTFAHLVAGTLYPTELGEVRRFGAAGPFELFRLKERIVHVSDDLQMLYTVDAPVEDVIVSGFASSIGLWHEPSPQERERANTLIAWLEIDELKQRNFLGLSFGERRKVLIARGLVRTPALLILDEVWNGLDSAFKERLALLLDRLALEGTTLLLIAHHDSDLPALITRRFVLRDGGLSPTET